MYVLFNLHDFMCNRSTIELLLIIALIGVTGMVMGMLITPKFIFRAKMSERLPFKVAQQFKDNFKVGWLARPFVPNTTCVVHDYYKLMKYLEEVRTHVFKDTSEPGDEIEVAGKKYKKGIAFYFGRSYRDHYVKRKLRRDQNRNTDIYACIQRKKYTVFLSPALYTEQVREVDRRRVRTGPKDDRANNMALPDPVSIEELNHEEFWSPFENKTPTNSEIEQFIKDAKDYFKDDPQDPFDLGHTHP